jgi:hypothetical protein
MLGFETNGIGGALVAVAFALFGVALLEERSDHKRDANGLGQLVER